MPAIKQNRLSGVNEKGEKVYPFRYASGMFKLLPVKGETSNHDENAKRVKSIADAIVMLQLRPDLCMRMAGLGVNRSSRVYRHKIKVNGQPLRNA
jgi:hypothetical protein